jgi:hypothetical protein
VTAPDDALAAIEARAAAATTLPWVVDDAPGLCGHDVDRYHGIAAPEAAVDVVALVPRVEGADADVALIVAAVNGLPTLLAALRAERAQHAADVAAAVAAERARARRCTIYSERFDGCSMIDALQAARGMIENGEDDEVCEYCHDTGVNAASSKPCRCCEWARVLAADASASDRDRLLIAAAPDLAADLLDARQERDALAAALRTERAAREAAEAREHRHSEALRVRDEAIADIAEALGLDADTPTAPIAQVAAAAVARADAADARSATLLMCGEAAERAATEAHAQHAALAGAVRAYLDADRDWRRSRYMIAEHINAAAVENTERLSVERYAAWAALDALLRGAPCGYVPAGAAR